MPIRLDAEPASRGICRHYILQAPANLIAQRMDVRHGANISAWDIRHSLAGRIRLYHPALHRRKQVCTAIEQGAIRVPEIQSCRANPTTGTALVHYELRRLRPEQIIEILDAALEDVVVTEQLDAPDMTLPLCAVAVPLAAVAQFAVPVLIPVATVAVACAAYPSFKRVCGRLMGERRLGTEACEPVVVAGCLATGAVFPASVVALGAEMSRSLTKKLRDQIALPDTAASDPELQDIARDFDARLERGRMLIVIPGILCAAGTLTLGFGLLASLLIGGAGSVIVLADLMVPLKRLAEKQLEREMLEDLRGMYRLEESGEQDYGAIRNESFEVVGVAG